MKLTRENQGHLVLQWKDLHTEGQYYSTPPHSYQLAFTFVTDIRTVSIIIGEGH